MPSSLKDIREEYEKFGTTTTEGYGEEKSKLHDQEQQEQPAPVVGYIDKSDFIVWTIIPAIGILFCLIHAEQEHLWQWTGDTAKDAQSLKAKVVVSIMSTVIGGCVVAVLMKAITGTAYTVLKYRGANFSQLVTMIGGYLPSHIPLLAAGGGWFSIIVIVLVLVVSVITKQLAVVSMSVNYISANKTMQSYTSDYTNCDGVKSADTMEGIRIGFTLNTYNSLINPNLTYSNEYYDRGIPANLQGTSSFERVLPYANVSCGAPFKSSAPQYNNVVPMISKNQSTTWNTAITVALNDEISAEMKNWINCTISAGHATAMTTCNDT